MRDYNADEKINWHDYYLEALSPVQTGLDPAAVDTSGRGFH